MYNHNKKKTKVFEKLTNLDNLSIYYFDAGKKERKKAKKKKENLFIHST